MSFLYAGNSPSALLHSSFTCCKQYSMAWVRFANFLRKIIWLIHSTRDLSIATLVFILLTSKPSVPYWGITGIKITLNYHKEYIPQNTFLDIKWGITLKLRPAKYPYLIEYYSKRGYQVRTDLDLRDLHAWVPLQLYSQLMAKSSVRFSRERGRISKAVVEALEEWLQDEKDA